MSEPPRSDRTEDGSAPWERPRHWNQQRLDATRVDDLLARLGNEDEMGGSSRRSRRRGHSADEEASAEPAVSASSLIAALHPNPERTHRHTVADDEPPAPNPTVSAAFGPAASAPATTPAPTTLPPTTPAPAPPRVSVPPPPLSAPPLLPPPPPPPLSLPSSSAVTDPASQAPTPAPVRDSGPPTLPPIAPIAPPPAPSTDPLYDEAAGITIRRLPGQTPGSLPSGSTGFVASPAGVPEAGVPEAGVPETHVPETDVPETDLTIRRPPRSSSGRPPVAVPPPPPAAGPPSPPASPQMSPPPASQPVAAPTPLGSGPMDSTQLLPLIRSDDTPDVASIRASLARKHAGGAPGTGQQGALQSNPRPTSSPAAQIRPAATVLGTPTTAGADAAERVADHDQAVAPRRVGPPAPVGAEALAGHSIRGPLLIVGRTVIAIVTATMLVLVGIRWNIWTTANDSLVAENQANASALVTGDTHISKPTVTRSAAPGGGDSAPLPLYEPENILLLGSDSRAGQNGDSTNSDGNQTTAQSDTLMVAHLSADRQNITIVSIPRDLEIQAPECNIWNSQTGVISDQIEPVTESSRWKITNAYAVGGPRCTVQAVQMLTGLRIDRIIGIDFNGFKSMVDALGGIQVNACRPIRDGELGLIIANAGQQVIHGDQALSLVRARKVADDGYGNDFGRIHRQQVVLSSILRQVSSAGTLLDSTKLEQFLNAFITSTFTSNIDLNFLVQLAQQMGDLAPDKVTFYTLPAGPNPEDGGDSQVMDPTIGPAVFSALVNDQPLPGQQPPATTAASSAGAASTPATTGTSTTPTSTPPEPEPEPQTLTVDPSAVTMQVVNVTGAPGVATDAMRSLNSLGFAVTEDQLLLPEGEVQDPITVEYSAGNIAAALTVAAAVPSAQLVEIPNLGQQVRLLLGSTYTGELVPVSVGQALPEWVQAAVSSATSDQSGGQVPAATQDGQAPAPTAASAPDGSSQVLDTSDLKIVKAQDPSCV